MPKSSVQLDYNHDLNALTNVLAKVKRPGEFRASGSLEAPMPRLEIEGVGTVSFPIPVAQARRVIQQGDAAPQSARGNHGQLFKRRANAVSGIG